ncbi:hypothetical protein RclHR1_07440016 [Rhizophagus clarus]|uniref:MULE transposase domain-containing protein n=1 Tax=Rhizophagus clarus TaxID=94130 RepID=A0A2Z6RYS0_9GLOM|nr:hypothetical protein RclHR1_07440016 [Rhizophagus clarus]
MTTISCTRCSLILDQSFFIKEKGGFYTRCINCRNQNNKYIRKRKEIEESQKSISILSYEELDQRLSEMIDDIGEEEYFENCETGIKFSCFIDISFLKNKTPKEIVDDIKNFIGKIDGYYYMPRKDENKEKHRDKIPIDRFDCDSTIKITINITNLQAEIDYTHGILHKRPERHPINENIKEFINSQLHLSPAEIFAQLELNNPDITQKQIHYWWTQIMKKNYQKDQDQLISSYLLLNERNYNIILMDLDGDWTLPANGAEFSAAYLFLDNAKKNNGIRTSILAKFFQELKNIGLKNIKYFFTDKDYSQINAAQIIWPSVKIQICLWHAKRAIKKKLADNELKNINQASLLNSKQQYDFIDIQWILSLTSLKTSNTSIFCPKDLRSEVLDLFVKHYHQHSLIPSTQNEFLSAQVIKRNAVEEMYLLCYKHNLIHLWGYLWTHWYQNDVWLLWARSASPDEICIFKITMLTESY